VEDLVISEHAPTVEKTKEGFRNMREGKQGGTSVTAQRKEAPGGRARAVNKEEPSTLKVIKVVQSETGL